jgi:hypothetical protein
MRFNTLHHIHKMLQNCLRKRILGTGADTLNLVQASYFERFHWQILNFWTLQTVEHDGNGTPNSMFRGL